MSDLAVVGENVDGVVTVTLNRPEKKNALSIALRDEMSDALDALSSDDAVRVVVITGAGAVFSAGFDLGEFADPDPEHQRRLWDSSDRFHHTVLRFPLPVVCCGQRGCAGRRLRPRRVVRPARRLRHRVLRARRAHVRRCRVPAAARPRRRQRGARPGADRPTHRRGRGARRGAREPDRCRVPSYQRSPRPSPPRSRSHRATCCIRTKAKIVAAADIAPTSAPWSSDDTGGCFRGDRGAPRTRAERHAPRSGHAA